VAEVLKLSSPATGDFWEIPILYEDEHLLVLDKPPVLLTAPDPSQAERPNLLEMARQRRPGYLMNAHGLDAGAGGVTVFVKNKSSFAAVADQFATDEPRRTYAALVRGSPVEDTFTANAKIGPHPLQMGVMRVDSREGKRSRTVFAVRERFDGYALLECRPLPDRAHQIPAHLKYLRLPLVGASLYGGQPLLLSTLKSGYRLKPGQTEHPLIAREALQAEEVMINHPITREKLTLRAPWPKDLTVAVKYLRRYAVAPG